MASSWAWEIKIKVNVKSKNRRKRNQPLTSWLGRRRQSSRNLPKIARRLRPAQRRNSVQSFRANSVAESLLPSRHFRDGKDGAKRPCSPLHLSQTDGTLR